LFSASGASGLSLDLGVAVALSGGGGNTEDGDPLGFASLAALRFVLELFVVKKQLFAGGEDELFPAIDALQDAISEFHGRLPRTQGNVLNRP
jgi:hypothetical protein